MIHLTEYITNPNPNPIQINPTDWSNDAGRDHGS